MWENKIVKHENVDPESLMAHPGNFRIHPSMQQKALEGSIEKLGFIRSVTVNVNTGTVVDGHLRVILALRNQEPTIPVEYVDLTEDEEREALLLLDPISALANTDKEKMRELLELVTGDSGLDEALRIVAENEKVMQSNIGDSSPIDIPVSFAILIENLDEAGQANLLEELTEKGFQCHALLS